MEYSDDLYVIRQIKFQILCDYEVKISEMNIWALSKDLSQIQWYTFSQKWEKCQTWVLEHHVKKDYVPNLRKTLQSQNWALKMFISYFMPIYKEQQSIGICNFWLKSAPKSHIIWTGGHYIIAIYIFTVEICHKKFLFNVGTRSFISPKIYG